MSAYYDLYQISDFSGEENKQKPHASILPKGAIVADQFLEIVHDAIGFSQAVPDGILQASIGRLQCSVFYSFLHEALTRKTKQQDVGGLSGFVKEEAVGKCGSGQIVVGLKGGDV